MRSLLNRLIGGGNDAHLTRIRPIVAAINELEPHYAALTDEQIRAEMEQVRREVAEAAPVTPASADELENPDRERRAEMRRDREKADTKRLQAALDDVLPDVFAAAREVSRRKLDMRPFDVQLMGGVVLHQGRISEMKTGEGKTLVATLPVYLNALAGRGVHVVTVNDYLASRDSEWMGQIYKFLGLTVGNIVHGMDDEERKKAYDCDVTYGTNNELGFDYLRDNMKYRLEDMVQRGHIYAIVDEVEDRKSTRLNSSH